MFSVYFIKSKKNGKVYTGFTEKDPLIRLQEHNSGSNDWSKNNKPYAMLYFESYCCKEDTLKREKFYKSGFGKLIKNSIIETIEKHNFWGRSSVG
jgi:putative endonuclease